MDAKNAKEPAELDEFRSMLLFLLVLLTISIVGFALGKPEPRVLGQGLEQIFQRPDPQKCQHTRVRSV